MTRFHIKVNPLGGVALKDRWAPAFVRSYATLDAACLAMDNIVRRDHGMPERVAITRREIREAMATYASIDRERLDEEMRREPVVVSGSWEIPAPATHVRVNGEMIPISSQAGLASFRGGAR